MSVALFLSRKKKFFLIKEELLGGEYFSFLKILDEAKQKQIYVPRKNKSKINLLMVNCQRKDGPREKNRAANF